ncbi:hypothetical protein [Ligilactobacillus sp. LYQ60]|uniref:hypothetical protein n=1 Tax=Ligilactobacillus sp. LYQ60 TaxID=3378799 RepID=UPI0038529473
MTFLGISLEDWTAIIGIAGTFLTILIRGFKWAFHSAYLEESEENKKTFDRLTDTVSTLNRTVESLRDDLSKNNSVLNEHEKRLIVLETKEGIYDDVKVRKGDYDDE